MALKSLVVVSFEEEMMKGGMLFLMVLVNGVLTF